MGHLTFCQKHFDILMKGVKIKEKEMKEKEGKNVFWAFIPLKVLKDILNKK